MQFGFDKTLVQSTLTKLIFSSNELANFSSVGLLVNPLGSENGESIAFAATYME